MEQLNPVEKRYRKITVWFCVANILTSVLYDIWVAEKAGAKATISRTTIDFSKAYPGLALLVGGLIGHLFYSQSDQ